MFRISVVGKYITASISEIIFWQGRSARCLRGISENYDPHIQWSNLQINYRWNCGMFHKDELAAYGCFTLEYASFHSKCLNGAFNFISGSLPFLPSKGFFFGFKFHESVKRKYAYIYVDKLNGFVHNLISVPCVRWYFSFRNFLMRNHFILKGIWFYE